MTSSWMATAATHDRYPALARWRAHVDCVLVPSANLHRFPTPGFMTRSEAVAVAGLSADPANGVDGQCWPCARGLRTASRSPLTAGQRQGKKWWRWRTSSPATGCWSLFLEGWRSCTSGCTAAMESLVMAAGAAGVAPTKATSRKRQPGMDPTPPVAHRDRTRKEPCTPRGVRRTVRCPPTPASRSRMRHKQSALAEAAADRSAASDRYPIGHIFSARASRTPLSAHRWASILTESS